MAHIHEKIDFTIAIFVLREGKALLIKPVPAMPTQVADNAERMK